MSSRATPPSYAPRIEADIAFVDPPYDFEAWDGMLATIAAPFVVAESGRAVPAPEGWEQTRVKRYGRTWVTFLHRDPGA